MLAIDWSHIKGFAIYDGEEERIITREQLLPSRGVSKYLDGETVIIETSAPLWLHWEILRRAKALYTVSGVDTAQYRKGSGLEKSDTQDAVIIYQVAQDPSKLSEVSIEEGRIKLRYLYHLYNRYTTAEAALANRITASERYFGQFAGAELAEMRDSRKAMLRRRQECLKELVKLAPKMPREIKQKGFGDVLWVSLVSIANPEDFTSVNAYLRFLGYNNRESLTDKKSGQVKYSRKAKNIYYQAVKQIVMRRISPYREMFDDTKVKLAELHPDWRPAKVDAAARNRVATKLARDVYRLMKTGHTN